MWCFIDVVFYMLLMESAKNLTDWMGQKTLSEYVKLFDLTLGLEAWLNRPEFTAEELKIAECFIKKFITDFTNVINCEEVEGMRLVKIHLLIHFVDCIWMYRSAMNFKGSTGESHLKSKTKQLAHRTWMCYIDMEYQTALKDYEQIVLGMGEMKVMNDMEQKLAAGMQIQLGFQYNVLCDEQGVFLHQYPAKKNEGVFDDWNHSYLHPDDLLEFLETHSLTSNVMLHYRV